MTEIVFPETKKKDEAHYNNEADLSTAIVNKFNRIKNVRCQKVKASSFGQPTLDIIGGRNGQLFWLEVKKKGNKPTDRQRHTMKKWIADGCIATWTDSLEGAMKFLLADWRQLTETSMLEGFHE